MSHVTIHEPGPYEQDDHAYGEHYKGEHFGMTAEGVETRAQLEKKNLGCEAGQGYLFAPPSPAPGGRGPLF